MLPSRKFDGQSNLAERFAIYSLFRHYYQGQWASAYEAVAAVEGYLGKSYEAGEVYMQAASASADTGGCSENALEFDYNRLFVGPAKLIAPPFESAYRNGQGLVMQKETLAVRDFYRKSGLAVISKNVVPDDHLGVELEFVCYLLAQAGRRMYTGETAAAGGFLDIYQDFFTRHIQTWVYCHCDDVVEKGRTLICKGVAAALADFLRSEQEELLSWEGAC